jgi:hypothetical protein
MIFKFKDWLFRQLPEKLQEIDSNKNPNGEGTLQRYLQAMNVEFDDNMVDFIEKFPDILDITTIPDSLLPFLGYNLGSPPDIDGTPTTYRKLLSYIVTIYKIKGTVCCYQLLFNLLGLGVIVYEYPKQTTKKYDEGNTYDEDDPILYDIPCEPCNEYDLYYWNLNDNCQVPNINPVPPAILAAIQEIICFIQPIDAKLKNLAQQINLCEDFTPEMENEVEITLIGLVAYDIGQDYDDGLIYDDGGAIGTTVYNF